MSINDPRIALAMDYLDGARRRKVTELPPSVLVRELAETRRQLGLVLDLAVKWELPPAPVLDPGQRAMVLRALDVAAEYWRYRASLTCQDCADHPAEVCPDHAADLNRADEYDALAARIGGGS
jgi:hypothetical protein